LRIRDFEKAAHSALSKMRAEFITNITSKVMSLIAYAATDKALTNWAEIDAANLPAQPTRQEETHELNYGVKLVITKGW
jgi:heat shock protein beta-11